MSHFSNLRNTKEAPKQFYFGFDKTELNESLPSENHKVELNEDINNNYSERINHATFTNPHQPSSNNNNNRVRTIKNTIKRFK